MESRTTTREWTEAAPALPLLRLGLGVVFLWFGALKYVPGLSPAESLVASTVGWAVDPHWFLPFLATWECVIGIGLLLGRFRSLTMVLLGLHLFGTFLPLCVCPDLVWTHFPYAWTLEGQYILKNLVLVSAAAMLAFPQGLARVHTKDGNELAGPTSSELHNARRRRRNTSTIARRDALPFSPPPNRPTYAEN